MSDIIKSDIVQKQIKKESVKLPISTLVKVANKNIQSHLSNLTESERESVLKVLESKSAALSKIVEGKNKRESKDKGNNVNQKKSPLGVNTRGTSVIGKSKRSPEEVKLDMVVKLLYN